MHKIPPLHGKAETAEGAVKIGYKEVTQQQMAVPNVASLYC